MSGNNQFELHFGRAKNQPVDMDVHIKVGGESYRLSSQDFLRVVGRLRQFQLDTGRDFGAELILTDKSVWIVQFRRTPAYGRTPDFGPVEFTLQGFVLIPDDEINTWKTFHQVRQYTADK